jgi:hypothetical protein
MTTTTTTIKQYFSDEEWDAIASALADYQDYGDEEAKIAEAIDKKIDRLFD